MKRLILAGLLALAATASTEDDWDHMQAVRSAWPEVRKFRDGPVTCYVIRGYHELGISCVVTKSEATPQIAGGSK